MEQTRARETGYDVIVVGLRAGLVLVLGYVLLSHLVAFEGCESPSPGLGELKRASHYTGSSVTGFILLGAILVALVVVGLRRPDLVRLRSAVWALFAMTVAHLAYQIVVLAQLASCAERVLFHFGPIPTLLPAHEFVYVTCTGVLFSIAMLIAAADALPVWARRGFQGRPIVS